MNSLRDVCGHVTTYLAFWSAFKPCVTYPYPRSRKHLRSFESLTPLWIRRCLRTKSSFDMLMVAHRLPFQSPLSDLWRLLSYWPWFSPSYEMFLPRNRSQYRYSPLKSEGQAVLGRQNILPTPWLTERHGYDPTCRTQTTVSITSQ